MAPEGPVFALRSYASAAIHAGKLQVFALASFAAAGKSCRWQMGRQAVMMHQRWVKKILSWIIYRIKAIPDRLYPEYVTDG
jgi:hypothetical protein